MGMRDTTLVIMAAGIGSRFGGGIKQLEPVGPNGEIIMDYSIHDALEAGFDRIIFVIRHDLEEDFKEVIGNRIEKIAPVTYAFQELSDVPEGFSVPADRKKPCGALWTDGKLHRRFAQTFLSLRTVLWICYGNGSSTVWVRSQPDSAYRAVAALCVYDYSGLPVYGGCGCYRGEERGIKNKKP